MSGYTFGDWFNPYGDDQHTQTAPRARAAVQPAASPMPQQFVNPQTGKPWRAGDHMGTMSVAPKPVVASKPAPATPNYSGQMAAWKNQMQQGLTTPKPAQSTASKTAPSTGSPSSMPPPMPSSSSGYQWGPSRTPQAAHAAPMAPPQEGGGDSMLGQLHQQHFGQLHDAVRGVNSAMSNAADQWSDAAARNQAYEHNAWQANQANQLEMARLASNERIAQAEINERQQRRQAIMGMANGISPLGRSLLG